MFLEKKVKKALVKSTKIAFLTFEFISSIYVSYLGPDRVLNILPLLQDLLDVIL
jgi:hypothetical protein